MKRRRRYLVEPVLAPIALNAIRSAIVPLAEGTAAAVQIRETGAYDVLVSDQIPERYLRTVAFHAVRHVGDPTAVWGEVTAWCERETCWAARAWLPLVDHLAVAGL